MATEMNLGDLDRYITGNYGEDQYPDECPGCEDEDNAGHIFSCAKWEDTRDFDSMPGGWDNEGEPDDSWLDSYWETE